MKKYPPYVAAYGQIANLLQAIKSASVPPKFTQDFLNTKLGLTSSSYRAMIPLLKNIGFLDQGNVPTQAYKTFRDDAQSGHILAGSIRSAYKELFDANEYAHKLSKKDLTTKLRTLLGVGDDDKNIAYVAGTFQELVKNADFEAKETAVTTEPHALEKSPEKHAGNMKLGISYTINLNLPATTEIEVFNAIFKSIKDNLLSTDESRWLN